MKYLEHPEINTRAWLALDESAEQLFPTRIEDTINGHLVIAAPLTAAGSSALRTLAAPPEDQKCTLIWGTEDGGYAKQSCQVMRVNYGKVETWEVETGTDAEVIQRRNFVRVPEDAQAHIHFSDRSADAQVLDISEGGIRCQTQCFSVMAHHYPCYIDLVIANDQVLIAAQIVRVEDNLDGTMTLGVEFAGIGNDHADLIRKHVYDRQVKLKNENLSEY